MRRLPTLPLTLGLSLSASGCDFVGDVLEFGVWVILILVLLVVGLAWGGFRAMRRMGDRRDPPNDPSDRYS